MLRVPDPCGPFGRVSEGVDGNPPDEFGGVSYVPGAERNGPDSPG